MAVTVKEDVLPGGGAELRLSSELTGHRGTRVRIFNVYGLTAADALYEAVTQPQIPKLDQAHDTIPGISVIDVVAKHFVDAADKAQVRVTYSTPPPIGGIINASFESGATLEQAETDFDGANRALPYNKRKPISVQYDSGSNGKPRANRAVGPNPTQIQGVRLPALLCKPSRIIRRVESADPGPKADQYVSKVSSAVFLGYSAGEVLCAGIVGQDNGDGKWLVTYTFLIDKDDQWASYARYWDVEQGKNPDLSVAQVAGENGIKRVYMQGTADFNELRLPKP